MSFRSSTAMRLPVILVVAAVTGQVSAQGTVDSNLGVRVTAATSSNVQRQTVNQRSTAYRGAALFFGNQRQGPRLDTSFAGDVDFREYSDESIPDQRVGSVNALLDIAVVPEIFTWNITDSYGQGRINPFATVSPVNQQEINVFSTGPRITAPVGNRNFVQMSATASRRRFDNTIDLDSDGEDVQLGYFRQISPVTDIGLSVANNKTTYDNNPLLTWEVKNVSINYQRQLARGAVTAQVGRNDLQFGTTQRDSPMFNVGWTRRLGARSVFALNALRNESDPGANFTRANSLLGQIGIGAANAFLGAGIFEYRDLGVRTTFNYDRTTLTIGLGAAQSAYENSTAFDNDQRRASINVTRQISERMDLGLAMDTLERDFSVLGRTDRDRNGRIWFTKQFTQRFSMVFTYLKWQRNSGGFAPFDEDMYQASFVVDLI